MKKLFLALLLLIAVAVQRSEAQQLKFYYYPTPNVYYDVANNQYIYLNNGTWVTTSALPPTVKVKGYRKVVVYNPTPQVWVNNSDHLKKYKVTPAPKGKAVGYKGTNTNKAQGKISNQAKGKTTHQKAKPKPRS